MTIKTLAELYGYKKPTRVHLKKMSSNALRNFIMSETHQILREQEEEKKATGKIGDAPRGDAVDKGTNVKDVDPIEIANQLLSGDDNSPIVKSAAVGKPWIEFDGAAGKAWIEKIGPDVFVQRLIALAGKVPSTGLPKSVMPFLPGPEDAEGEPSDVEDALTPGGDYNIDFNPPFKEAAWKRGARFLIEQEKDEKEKEGEGEGSGTPPAPNTFVGMDAPGAEAFMKAGLEDGDPDDDKITINLGGSVAADKAIPTQSNILIYKSLGMAVNGLEGGDLDAWAGIGGEILDGHHRWAATMLNNPSADMGTAGQVDLQALGDEKKTLKYLTALGNALGNATKTESFHNRNDKLILERWQRMAGLL